MKHQYSSEWCLVWEDVNDLFSETVYCTEVSLHDPNFVLKHPVPVY